MKAHECGCACVKASMQTVWLVEKMESSGVFEAAHWFAVLIIAFSASCLLLYVKGAEEGVDAEQEKAAVFRLQAFCSRWAHTSSSMSRCADFLQV